jgi:hypothetical protein
VVRRDPAGSANSTPRRRATAALSGLMSASSTRVPGIRAASTATTAPITPARLGSVAASAVWASRAAPSTPFDDDKGAAVEVGDGTVDRLLALSRFDRGGLEIGNGLRGIHLIIAFPKDVRRSRRGQSPNRPLGGPARPGAASRWGWRPTTRRCEAGWSRFGPERRRIGRYGFSASSASASSTKSLTCQSGV